jgi:integrase
MAKKLTELGIERLKAKANTYTRVVDGNLYIKINSSGKKVWMYRYTESGTNRRLWISLGDLTETNNRSVAIEKVAEYDKNIEKIGDPLTVTEGDQTFEELFSLFISKGVDRQGKPLNETTITSYEYGFNANVLPYLGKQKVNDLRKRDILPVLEKMVDRGAICLANLTYKRMKRVFNFAAARDIIEFSPMINMEPVGETKSRDRVLSNEEIKTFMEWRPKSEEAYRALRLILITGARPGEVAGICKAEIDGDWWTIPGERSKTGAENRIFLTDMAKELLPEDSFTINRPAVAGCLKRAINAGQEMKEKGQIKGYIYLSIPRFTPHDLRRTMATNLAELGFTDEIINACQGRAKQGVIATYNRYRYDKERQLAAEAWSRKLAAIMSGEKGDNVISITR